MNAIIIILHFILNIQASNSFSVKTSDYQLKVTKVSSNLGIPWALSFIEDSILINDRNGFIQVLNLKTKKVKTVQFQNNLEVSGQGGLLDIIKDPHFKTNSLLYFTYSKRTKKGVTVALAKGLWDKKLKTVSSIQDIFIADAYSDTSLHFGSRLAFDHKGFLYMSIGERGVRTNSQELTNHAGKILKITTKGMPASGNPFIESRNYKKEIWSYGHRNPQGLHYDPLQKKLWSIEHGPRGGDEINLIEKAANYGWPIISYGKEYWSPLSVGEGTHKSGMKQPIKQFSPSIAPCGLIVYSGKVFKKWKGHLFSGALKLRHLNKIHIEKNNQTTEARLLLEKSFRIRTVKEGPLGYIYFTTDKGNLYKIEPVKE